MMATEVRRRVANGGDAGDLAGPPPSRHARPGRDGTTGGDGGRKRRRGRGRPRGSQAAVDVVIVERPACLRCGSTLRSPYWARELIACPGTDHKGHHVRRRRCRCLTCGRVRIEEEHLQENYHCANRAAAGLDAARAFDKVERQCGPF